MLDICYVVFVFVQDIFFPENDEKENIAANMMEPEYSSYVPSNNPYIKNRIRSMSMRSLERGGSIRSSRSTTGGVNDVLNVDIHILNYVFLLNQLAMTVHF